ncbi:MAG: MASE1 domain-containing protein [Xanthobacteraceae bacterium]
MAGDLLAQGQRLQFAIGDLSWRWAGRIGLAAAVGVAYFLAAKLSVGFVIKGVAVFWPAAGISSGVLIVFGPHVRWPVSAGVIVATVAAHLTVKDPLWAGVALGLCNAVETLITAGLIQHFFGTGFNIVRLRNVIGLLAAAAAGAIVSGIGGAVTYRLWHGPSAPMLTTWQHWFASDVVGIIAVAPLVIGLAAFVQRPSPRSEVIEGTLALVALAAMTGFIIWLPHEPWETAFPITWLFPILLWLAARCRPDFSAVGAFVVSITIVWTTILGIGHFGDPSLPIADRVMRAQAGILVVAFSAYFLAALFAERRESATQLAHSYTMLERERDNKLMNAQAIVAAIAHEIRQPLTRITTGGNAAQRFLKMVPPEHDKAQTALDGIVNAGHRTSEVIDGFRALFAKNDQGQQLVDVNEIIRGVLESLSGDLNDHHVEPRCELMSELPHVSGNRSQLQQVVSNLIANAIEAMETTSDQSRVLLVRTELRDRKVVAVEVKDSGPGIDKDKLDSIFTAFVSTKRHGMGLGLAICRMIIEYHGGKLTASSDGKDGGAVFELVLPIASVDKDGARAE